MTSQRAPEPTMDEILASIKRIIAEEDQSHTPGSYRPAADRAPTQYDDAEDANRAAEYSEGEEQLIQDIARALERPEGHDDPDDEAGATQDDILDLTSVVEDVQPAEDPGPISATDEEDLFEIDSPLREEAAPPFASDPVEPSAAADDAMRDETFSLEDEFAERQGDNSPSAPMEALSPAQEDNQADAEAELAPITESGDDPWALDSALAEGEPETSAQPDFVAAFPAPTDNEEAAETDAAPAPGDLSDTPDADVTDESSDVPGPAKDPASADAEFDADDEQPAETEPSLASEEVIAPGAAAELAEADAGEPALPAAQAVGPGALEDCVREMLRPMLREWLDENLPRILETELKQELEARRPHKD